MFSLCSFSVVYFLFHVFSIFCHIFHEIVLVHVYILANKIKKSTEFCFTIPSFGYLGFGTITCFSLSSYFEGKWGEK